MEHRGWLMRVGWPLLGVQAAESVARPETEEVLQNLRSAVSSALSDYCGLACVCEVGNILVGVYVSMFESVRMCEYVYECVSV